MLNIASATEEIARWSHRCALLNWTDLTWPWKRKNFDADRRYHAAFQVAQCAVRCIPWKYEINIQKLPSQIIKRNWYEEVEAQSLAFTALKIANDKLMSRYVEWQKFSVLKLTARCEQLRLVLTFTYYYPCSLVISNMMSSLVNRDGV